MSFDQPGPYGGQPQQPGPYGGQPQQPGPYGQGGPQPPQGRPGYGYPQQGGPVPPQPGHPQQPPYSQPQPGGYITPPPPPQGGGKGRTIGIVAGAVGAVLVIGGVWWFAAGGSSDLADDGPHKLTTPEKIFGGEYTRMGDGSQASQDEDDKEDLRKSGVENGQSVSAIYSTADVTKIDPTNPSAMEDLKSAKSVTLFGAYGDVKDPEGALDSLFAEMKADSGKESGDDTKLVGSPEDVSPDGLDNAIMKCQSVEGKNKLTGQPQTGWFCAWADYSTLALVAPDQGRQALGKDQAAEIAAKLRSEVRVKK